MGRRAKNKQGDPRPFEDAQEKGNRKESSKKLGKRKAEAPEEDVSSKRPVKKTKTKEEGKGKKVAFAKEKTSDKKGKRKQESEDEDELVEDAGSSEGWEDVEDKDDLQTQRK